MITAEKDLMMNKKSLDSNESTDSSSDRRLEREDSWFLYWYIAVFAFLVLQIVVYYLITQHFK